MSDRPGPGLVSVVGGESTGKSSLAAARGEVLPAVVVTEYLRTWVDQRDGRVPLPSEQSEVMIGHQDSEVLALHRAAQSGFSWVVSDSGPLMTAVYSLQYYDDPSLLPAAVEWTRRSTVVLLCQDDFPWQPDPQRDGPPARTTSQRILAEVFADHPDLPMLVVAGSLNDRIADVLSTMGRKP